MKLRRILSMTLAGALTIGAMAGCGASGGTAASGSGAASGDGAKIGYINLADTDVFCMTREKAFVRAAEEKGWSVSCTDGNNDSQKQIDQAKSFIAQGVDALVIVPCDAAACVPAVEEANRAGVPVIVFGNDLTGADDLDYTFIGSPHTVSGEMEGEYMAEALPENAKVCYLAGTAGLDHAAMRRDGTHSALEAAGRTDVEFLDDQDGDYVKDEGMRITQAWIQKFADGDGVQFDAIISANDQMALGAIEALKGANIPVGTDEGEVLVCGIDGSDEGLQNVKDGYMALTVLQDAPGQGKAAVEAIQTILDGGKPDHEINVDYVPVTAENIDEYIDYNK